MRLQLGACAALLLLVPVPARAYKRTVNSGGLCIFWNARGHSFQIDALGTPDVVGPAAFDAVRRSFQTWAAVSCSDLVFPDLGLSTDPADRKVGYFPGATNRNLVLWRTRSCSAVVPAGDPCIAEGGCSNKYDCWDRGAGVIATTTTTSNSSTGQIWDADIELNDAPSPSGAKFTFTTVDSPACAAPPQGNANTCVSIDVQNTLTHEAGHSIGLDHSAVPTATMYANSQPGEISKRVLDPDDIAGACAIYPKGMPTSTCLPDSSALAQNGASDGGGCGCSARGRAGGLEAPLAIALFLLLGWSRRGRRTRT